MGKKAAAQLITNDGVRKLAAAVLDHGKLPRLKVLAARYNKADIAAAREEETGFALLQFAVIVGNIPAVEMLMGLGCDKDATWDCGNGRDDGWDLDWLHSHVAQRFGGLCENIASPNVATDAFAYSSFTLLHLAALANQHDTVRYLVEKCNFPVDLCAGGSRITPLMAVITRKCGSPGGFEKAGVVLHTEACGITNKRQDESEYLDQPYCVPLFPMTQLLIELGASLGATDACGSSMIAVAAESAAFGQWDDLIEGLPDIFNSCPVHAGDVIYSAAAALARTPVTGKPEQVSRVVGQLQQWYRAAGRQQDFQRQMNEPVRRRGVCNSAPDQDCRDTHALCPLISGSPSEKKVQVLMALLGKGMRLTALLLGQPELLIDGGCDRRVLLRLLTQLDQDEIQESARVLVGLLCGVFLSPEPTLEADPFAPTLSMLVNAVTAAGIILRDEQLWPKWFAPEIIDGYGFCSRGRVSPLTLAAATGNADAVGALLKLYNTSAWADTIDLCGCLPLIEAAARGHADVVRKLLEHRADIFATDSERRTALIVAIEAGEAGVAVRNMLFDKLKCLKRSQAERVIAYLQRPGKDDYTAADVAVIHQAPSVLDTLADLGAEIFSSPLLGHSLHVAIRAAYGAKSENTDTLQCILKHMVDPQTGTQPQVVRALMQATYSAGLDGVEMTALGRSIAYGMTALVELLIGFCRLLLLPLEPLLEQHQKDCPSDHPLPLLVALRHGHYEAIEVLDLAGMSFNSDAGHCVFTRGDELLSVHCLAAQLGAHKALAIFIKGDGHRSPEPWANKCYLNAMTHAIEFPDDAHSSSSKEEISPSHLRCVLQLLQAKTGMDGYQLGLLLSAVRKWIEEDEVAQELWVLLRTKVAICAGCGLIGTWRKCSGCKQQYYCGRRCQMRMWQSHRKHCSKRTAGINCV